MHSCIHAFIRSFIHSFVRSFIFCAAGLPHRALHLPGGDFELGRGRLAALARAAALGRALLEHEGPRQVSQRLGGGVEFEAQLDLLMF